ncbi:MAG: hypothetical protein ACRDLT_14440, partial [Solirubrobacteraceae bacterium]
MLSAALPAVDELLVRKLGDALEQLHELQRQYDELNAARTEVAALVSGEARAYARGLLAVRGERLRAGNNAYERARTAVRDADTAFTDATGALRAAEDEAKRLHTRYRHVDEEHLELVGSDAYKAVARLEDCAREHEAAQQRALGAQKRLAGREAELKRAEDAQAAEQDNAATADARLAEAAGELNALLQIVGIKPVEPDPPALDALPARLELRKQDVDRALDLAAAVTDAEAQLRAVADPLAQAAQRRDQMGTAAAHAQELLEAAVEGLDAALHDWRLTLTELRIADESVDSIAATLVAGGDARTLVEDCAAPRAAELRTERAQADACQAALGVALRDARERVTEIEGQREPEPAPRSARRGSRVDRPGAPLWAASDFRDEVSADDRAGLEAALEDAGLLDAWISPNGTIHEADLTLLALADGPSAAAEHGTLADLLAPDRADARIEPTIVAAVLRSIPLQGPLSVAPGRFRFGALHGRALKPAPEYIGASARAALRTRLLQEACAIVEDLESQTAVLSSEVDLIAAAQARLDDEQRRLPPVEALRSAQAAERRTAERLTVAEEQLAAVVSQRDEYDRTVATSRVVLVQHAGAANLSTEPVGLRSVAQAVERAGGAIEAVGRALEGADAATQRVAQSAQRFDEARAATREAREDDTRAADELATADGRLAAAQTADGASAAELRARASSLRTEREQLDRAKSEAEQELRRHVEARKDAERAAADAQTAVTTAETERVSALDSWRALGAHDLFSAALGADAPADERNAANWTLTTALERLRALPPLQQDVDLGARARRVSEAASRVATKLVAFDMDAATYTSGDITLVDITREGHRRTPTAMLDELNGDLEHREQVLSAKRREVLGRALL